MPTNDAGTQTLYGGGTLRTSGSPAYATPDYSPPPTNRGAATDWDAVAAAWGSGIRGGQSWGAGQGNPASYYSASPQYIQDYMAAVSRAAEGSTAAQKAAAEQNARAAQAIMDAAGRSSDAMMRGLPIVINPGDQAFQLHLPQQGGGSAGRGGIPIWAYAAAGGAAFLAWRWWRAKHPKGA